MPNKLVEKLRKWYQGEYIPYENDPNSDVVFVGGHYKRTILATIVRAIVEFHSRDWKWAIPVYLTILGFIIAL